jgi:hypothetical protein
MLPTDEPYCNLLTDLFVLSWDGYLETQPRQARQLTPKDVIDTTLKETATTPVAMELDQIMADSPQLAAFVTDQATKSTDKLCCQVSQLHT